VLVDDGAIVVLGGLMEDEYTERGQGARLGDIPVVGNLFKSRNRSAPRPT
jgi:general secretion pathway protein D